MDFDYQNHIKDRAGIINWWHYKEFCFTGVAYETRLASYTTPNRTLASYTEAKDKKTGLTVQVRGFWGDIINSPYHTFGTTTDPEDKPRLFTISGSMYRHSETDIAEFNLTAYLSEMETGQPFHLPPEKPEEHIYPYASPLDELRLAGQVEDVTDEPPKKTDANPKESAASQRKRRQRSPKRADWPPLVPAFEDVEVVLLAGDVMETLKKPRYKGMFHRAFVGAMGSMGMLQEMGLGKVDSDPFFNKTGETVRIKRPPRL